MKFYQCNIVQRLVLSTKQWKHLISNDWQITYSFVVQSGNGIHRVTVKSRRERPIGCRSIDLYTHISVTARTQADRNHRSFAGWRGFGHVGAVIRSIEIGCACRAGIRRSMTIGDERIALINWVSILFNWIFGYGCKQDLNGAYAIFLYLPLCLYKLRFCV